MSRRRVLPTSYVLLGFISGDFALYCGMIMAASAAVFYVFSLLANKLLVWSTQVSF